MRDAESSPSEAHSARRRSLRPPNGACRSCGHRLRRLARGHPRGARDLRPRDRRALALGPRSVGVRGSRATAADARAELPKKSLVIAQAYRSGCEVVLTNDLKWMSAMHRRSLRRLAGTTRGDRGECDEDGARQSVRALERRIRRPTVPAQRHLFPLAGDARHDAGHGREEPRRQAVFDPQPVAHAGEKPFSGDDVYRLPLAFPVLRQSLVAEPAQPVRVTTLEKLDRPKGPASGRGAMPAGQGSRGTPRGPDGEECSVPRTDKPSRSLVEARGCGRRRR